MLKIVNVMLCYVMLCYVNILLLLQRDMLLFYFFLSQPRGKEVFVGGVGCISGGWGERKPIFYLIFPMFLKAFRFFFFFGMEEGVAGADSVIPCQF